MRSIGVPELLILFMVIPVLVVLTVVPYWKIFSKAGWSGLLCLLMVVPLANLIVLWVFAFSEWPALRDRKP